MIDPDELPQLKPLADDKLERKAQFVKDREKAQERAMQSATVEMKVIKSTPPLEAPSGYLEGLMDDSFDPLKPVTKQEKKK